MHQCKLFHQTRPDRRSPAQICTHWLRSIDMPSCASYSTGGQIYNPLLWRLPHALLRLPHHPDITTPSWRLCHHSTRTLLQCNSSQNSLPSAGGRDQKSRVTKAKFVNHLTWLARGGADAAGSPFHVLGLQRDLQQVSKAIQTVLNVMACASRWVDDLPYPSTQICVSMKSFKPLACSVLLSKVERITSSITCLNCKDLA